MTQVTPPGRRQRAYRRQTLLPRYRRNQMVIRGGREMFTIPLIHMKMEFAIPLMLEMHEGFPPARTGYGYRPCRSDGVQWPSGPRPRSLACFLDKPDNLPRRASVWARVRPSTTLPDSLASAANAAWRTWDQRATGARPGLGPVRRDRHPLRGRHSAASAHPTGGYRRTPRDRVDAGPDEQSRSHRCFRK